MEQHALMAFLLECTSEIVGMNRGAGMQRQMYDKLNSSAHYLQPIEFPCGLHGTAKRPILYKRQINADG